MLKKSCTINDALMYMFGWKKISKNYDFEPKPDNTNFKEPSFEEVLIEKTESASINHSNVNFLKVRADDCLCDMDDELAKLAESKLTDSEDTYVNNERKIIDTYLEKLKDIKSISILPNDEIVEPREIGESRANFRKREQEIADANLAKLEADGCLHDMNVELTKLIESNLSSDSRATFEKRSKEIVDAELAKLEYLNSIKTKAEGYLCAIDVELKKDEPELIVDPSATTNPNYQYITIFSLNMWAKQFGITIIDTPESLVVSTQNLKPADNTTWSQINLVQTQLTVNKYSTLVVTISNPPSDIKPWDIPYPKDPEVKEGEEWFTAARYLARQYLADHPGLSITKQKLAVKVAELMTNEKIVHSGNTPYADSTVRKAFRRVTF